MQKNINGKTFPLFLASSYSASETCTKKRAALLRECSTFARTCCASGAPCNIVLLVEGTNLIHS